MTRPTDWRGAGWLTEETLAGANFHRWELPAAEKEAVRVRHLRTTRGLTQERLHAAHDLADHIVQTDAQALGKASDWRAMAGHVSSYHATQVAALAAADRVLGLRLSPWRTAVAVAWSAGTHALLDRRWPVRRLLERTGSVGFARNWFPLDEPMEMGGTPALPIPLHGPYLADQSLHHACLWVAALIIAGGTR